jgi:hypothetical protein
VKGSNPSLSAIDILKSPAAPQVTAQNHSPKHEVFSGYAAPVPMAGETFFTRSTTFPNAFDASNRFYLPGGQNLGLLMDGSGHCKGSTTPPNVENGSNDSTGVGYALGGLQ